ncbi:MAG: DUF1573 domain-containing protein [Candidatus Omnitrophica bacterium]|nr:DUF1573 domain-containing protein [Candidatus Omnitrophota bacterium]
MYKRLYTASLLVACSIFIAYNSASAALISINKVWDFGDVQQGESKQKIFEIKNTGRDTVIIKKIHTCCGYNVADVSSWEIGPGQKSKIELACNAKRKHSGNDNKYITILSDSPTNSQLKIPVKALIIKGKNSNQDLSFQEFKEAKVEERKTDIPSITAGELYSRMQEGEKLIILDVREKSEYTQKHIPNSLRFSRSEMAKDEDGLKNLLRNVDKPTLVAAHCGSGTRSAYVTGKLRSWGHKALNLSGGLKSWEKEGYPVVYGKKADPSYEPIEINLEEAYDYYYSLFSAKTVWIDARDREEYREGHIKGAINLPIDEIPERLSSIPKNKSLVLYCQGIDCDSSKAVARILLKSGFKQGKVRHFAGGYDEWHSASYPVDRGRLTRS